MPICAVFLHVAFDIGPKHLLLTIGTCSILVFSQVLNSDVPLAVGLVGEGAFAGETGKGSIKLSLAELVGCFQQCHCNRLRFNLEIFQPNALVLATSTTRINFTGGSAISIIDLYQAQKYHMGFDIVRIADNLLGKAKQCTQGW